MLPVVLQKLADVEKKRQAGSISSIEEKVKDKVRLLTPVRQTMYALADQTSFRPDHNTFGGYEYESGRS